MWADVCRAEVLHCLQFKVSVIQGESKCLCVYLCAERKLERKKTNRERRQDMREVLPLNVRK